jgi:hypothetical protein
MRNLIRASLACVVLALATFDAGAQVTTIPTRHNQGKLYSMPDASAVSLADIYVPTEDTACGAVIFYFYTVTDGTDTAVHFGQVAFLARNDDGTVTAAQPDADETALGTGCNAACDTWASSVSGTTATFTASFNNSLSAVGNLRYTIVADSGCTLIQK